MEELCSVDFLVTPERGYGTPWQYSWCCRKCSARVQSWNLFAPCLIGIASALIKSPDRKTQAVFLHPQYTTVGTLSPLSPVPGGRGFLWLSASDSMFTQATQRPWQRQTLSWRRTHLREDFSLSIYKPAMNNSNLEGVDVFSN